MNKEEFKHLIESYKSGNLTPAEEKKLFLHYNKILEINSLEDFDETKAMQLLDKSTVEDIFTRIPKQRHIPWRSIAAAASVLLIASITFYYKHQPTTEIINYSSIEHAAIVPAPQTKAVAILPNGDSILIDGAQDYKKTIAGLHNDASLANQFITLKTAAAGKLNFTLPDGSQVWLNAASTLVYPMAFGKDSRSVKLDGEAYFEIVKAKIAQQDIPFIVQANDQKIKVLGTKFNVSNYGNEHLHKTTLAEGAVSVEVLNQKAVLLKPNQQLLQSGDQTQVISVDARDIIAWKEGIISLSKQDFPAIARIIERNYDVTFVDKTLPKGVKMNGELQTNLALNELLATLELTMHVKFLIDGRNIKIQKQQ